ncbi:thymic stromal lymphopoietin [Phyllostomus discolor]|uniref:Thymic stromal lymphopoietin n=1 Tax=Phyllostomus discolor TaxID=89673 RepID=A0A834B7R6_9CHIR|nr:thymic stromal lymphopoietin [Phyllostomus discolor]
MVFFRKIFTLQLVGLVLTYNFHDCDFERIRKDYENIIFKDLKLYVSGTTCIGCNIESCDSPPACLSRIARFTFSDPRCKSLAKKMFAMKTNATLTQECPGYSGMQTNNTQAMTRRKKREDTKNACLEIASNLIGLWGRFARS